MTVTNAELAKALRTVAQFLEGHPQMAVDEQVRVLVAELIGEVSKRQARLLLDSNLSSLTSWLGRFGKKPPAS